MRFCKLFKNKDGFTRIKFELNQKTFSTDSEEKRIWFLDYDDKEAIKYWCEILKYYYIAFIEVDDYKKDDNKYYTRSGVTRTSECERIEIKDKLKMFLVLCIAGDLEYIKILYEKYKFSAEAIKAYNKLFTETSRKGHLEVLKFLTSIYKYTEEDIKGDDNYAFEIASDNGHIEVLEFLNSII